MKPSRAKLKEQLQESNACKQLDFNISIKTKFRGVKMGDKSIASKILSATVVNQLLASCVNFENHYI